MSYGLQLPNKHQVAVMNGLQKHTSAIQAEKHYTY